MLWKVGAFVAWVAFAGMLAWHLFILEAHRSVEEKRWFAHRYTAQGNAIDLAASDWVREANRCPEGPPPFEQIGQLFRDQLQYVFHDLEIEAHVVIATSSDGVVEVLASESHPSSGWRVWRAWVSSRSGRWEVVGSSRTGADWLSADDPYEPFYASIDEFEEAALRYEATILERSPSSPEDPSR